MSASIALSNFLSFLSPSTNPHPKTTLPLSLSYPSSQKAKMGRALSVVASKDGDFSALSTELASVICPSSAYANTLFFKSAYNVQVMVNENEPEENLLSRFRREVMKAGVIQECKRRRYFESNQDEKKRKSREAARRNRRRRPQPRLPIQKKEEVSPSKKDEEDDGDNWDLPEGDLPY